MSQMGEKTKTAGEMARRPGGASAAEVGAALGIRSGDAGSRLISATPAFGLHRAVLTKHGRHYRWFGTVAEAEAWGTLAPFEERGHASAGFSLSGGRKPAPASKPAPVGSEVDTSRARHTVCPSVKDHRFTVRHLPADYVSQISAAEARPWVAAAMSKP